jgi:hypothetical protein
MKITFKKLFYLIAFLSFSLGAKAQYSAVPDTARISLGLDAAFPQGGFADSYSFGLGASLQVDFPINEALYFTANLAYDSYFPNNKDIVGNPQAIAGVDLPNLNVLPLKVGLKWFIIRTFYVQAEGGEALLLNKSVQYANYSTAFTYTPQIGILFKLNNRKYLDVGFRYERMQSFFSGYSSTNFLALKVAYGLNLK